MIGGLQHEARFVNGDGEVAGGGVRGVQVRTSLTIIAVQILRLRVNHKRSRGS